MIQPAQDPRNVMTGGSERSFKAFVGAVGLIGSLVLLAVVARGDFGAVPSLSMAAFVVSGLLLISELRPLFTAGTHDTNGVVLSTAFVFAILLRYDLAFALSLQALAVIISDATKRKAIWRTVFNVGQYSQIGRAHV